jgi:hypothetical protein
MYSSSNIIRMTKTRVMWVERVARMGGTRNEYNFWSENLKGRDHSEDLDVEGRIILE